MLAMLLILRSWHNYSAAPAAFDDDIDVSTAGTANLGSDITSADKTQYFASRNGIVVKAVVAGGTIPCWCNFKRLHFVFCRIK